MFDFLREMVEIFRSKRRAVFEVKVSGAGAGIQPPEELVKAVREAVVEDLPRDLWNIFGLKVHINIIEERPFGSVSIFFEVWVILSGLFFSIATYPSFVQGVKLIHRHAQSLIDAVLDRQGGNIPHECSVEVNRLLPVGEMQRPDRAYQILLALCIVVIALISMLCMYTRQ